jgi:hypothetical protein
MPNVMHAQDDNSDARATNYFGIVASFFSGMTSNEGGEIMRRCVFCEAEILPQTEVCPQCRRAANVGDSWVLIAVVLLTFGLFGGYLFWLGFSALYTGRALLWAYIVPVELEGAEAFGFGLFMSGIGLVLLASPVLCIVKVLMNFVRRRDAR